MISSFDYTDGTARVRTEYFIFNARTPVFTAKTDPPP